MKWTTMRLPTITVLLAAVYATGSAQLAAAEEQILFNRDIRPILSENCFQCHGPDQHARKADMRLDTQEGAHDTVIIPGQPEQSELIRRISLPADDPDHMPHHKSGKDLTQRQIDLLTRWVAEGAEYQGHWAFIAPRRAEPPQVAPDWVENPIDAFIARRLQSEGLTPSPSADRRTLIRRVTLDLTGLPPTLQEVRNFVEDTSPNAYERVVDRLLKSPHYGEHMGRYWLDAARYGDTHGLHLDNYREIWPYRDWVIEAFNANKSFDQFIVEQLAGDLIAGATLDQQVATGFLRAHVTTNEGGSIPEEVQVRNVVDRTETFGTVFLGLTAGCAVCHDHKYDPLTQKEFFELYAFFNSIDGSPMDGNIKDHPPVVRVPTAEQHKQIAELRRKLEETRSRLAEARTHTPYTDPGPEADAGQSEPVETIWIDDAPPPAAQTQGTLEWVGAPDHPVHGGEKSLRTSYSDFGQAVIHSADPPLVVNAGDTLFTWVYLDPANPPRQIMLQWNDGTWDHRAYWGENLIGFGQDGTVSRRHIGPLPEPGKWARLEVKAEQVGLSAERPVRGWAFSQHSGTVYWDTSGTVSQEARQFRSLAAWIDYERQRPASSAPEDVAAIIKLDPAQRTEAHQQKLQAYFLEHVCVTTRPTFEPLHKQVANLKSQIQAVEKAMPTTLVWKELAEPKAAHFLIRGEYDRKGDQVHRGTPAFLPPLQAEGQTPDRMDLAQWLVDPSHPLTARVAVNRFWQQVFGTGIVKTAEDFGTQGEWPSHPELLDWLATEFVRSGWDVKGLMKLIVTSATYRQSSNVTPKLIAKDPTNRLLARGPRFRLDAEVLRDQALALSGLLYREIGGPSVKPPQPPGLWEAVGYSGSNTVRFAKDEGHENVHRRSMYTFWKRTAVAPQMSTFDAPSRESCVVRRERTNTPLQALLLMNDPQYVEAARYFGQRAIDEGGDSAEARVAWMFEAATARPPAPQEQARLVTMFQENLQAYREDPSAAAELIKIGEQPADTTRYDAVELAAWTMVANLVLNLDEMINKG